MINSGTLASFHSDKTVQWEWHKYSYSENSLLSYQSGLAALVVSWRRLELKLCATLIQTELDQDFPIYDGYLVAFSGLLDVSFNFDSHQKPSANQKIKKAKRLARDEIENYIQLAHSGKAVKKVIGSLTRPSENFAMCYQHQSRIYYSDCK
ncbi:hypothetical protein VP01_1651g5 [Puccinia sorghi]|uniref:Uncharacterized protein n=1 Tax=Puccinia sorghi TaxID=27349 RepID=A0A0L6VH36_9BASI|nr:hypothetical protein VP01_1651g5 [Puccinia sorghi]